MRIVLGFLVLLTLFGGVDVEAGKKKQKNRTPRVVIVRDYTTGAWEGVVEAVVEDFNAVMPEGRGPRLIYQREAEQPCAETSHRQGRRGLAVCSSRDPSYGGQAQHRLMRLSDVHAGAALYERERVACHEMMHALTGIRDNYGARPDTSCVWGNLTEPGPFDVKKLRKTFKRR